jgi:hypothetical protein
MPDALDCAVAEAVADDPRPINATQLIERLRISYRTLCRLDSYCAEIERGLLPRRLQAGPAGRQQKEYDPVLVAELARRIGEVETGRWVNRRPIQLKKPFDGQNVPPGHEWYSPEETVRIFREAKVWPNADDTGIRKHLHDLFRRRRIRAHRFGFMRRLPAPDGTNRMVLLGDHPYWYLVDDVQAFLVRAASARREARRKRSAETERLPRPDGLFHGVFENPRRYTLRRAREELNRLLPAGHPGWRVKGHMTLGSWLRNLPADLAANFSAGKLTSEGQLPRGEDRIPGSPLLRVTTITEDTLTDLATAVVEARRTYRRARGEGRQTAKELCDGRGATKPHDRVAVTYFLASLPISRVYARRRLADRPECYYVPGEVDRSLDGRDLIEVAHENYGRLLLDREPARDVLAQVGPEWTTLRDVIKRLAAKDTSGTKRKGRSLQTVWKILETAAKVGRVERDPPTPATGKRLGRPPTRWRQALTQREGVQETCQLLDASPGADLPPPTQSALAADELPVYLGHFKKPYITGRHPDPQREVVLQFAYDQYAVNRRPAKEVVEGAQRRYGPQYAPRTKAEVKVYCREWAGRFVPPLPTNRTGAAKFRAGGEPNMTCVEDAQGNELGG